ASLDLRIRRKFEDSFYSCICKTRARFSHGPGLLIGNHTGPAKSYNRANPWVSGRVLLKVRTLFQFCDPVRFMAKNKERLANNIGGWLQMQSKLRVLESGPSGSFLS